ncbi:gntR family transcriptional regulator [Salmonella enterica subsp. enterica]|nr:gntR family transcriptional regulator [Salmonella enterica subsp. enterica] [Salmonella enterica subsp. enterica serovar Menston]
MRSRSNLAIPAGSDVFLLKRIRYVDEDAVSIEESWVPAHLIHDVDAIGISLYDYFRRQHIYPQRTRSASAPGCRMMSFSRIFKWMVKCRCW